MSNRLSSYSGKRYVFTIGEIAARGDLASMLPTLSFANSTVFMSGDQIGDILADYTEKYYVSNVDASGNIEQEFINALLYFWELRKNDFYKMYTAVTKNYDPLSNYDMIEEVLAGRKLDTVTDTNTKSGSATTTETPTGTITKTITPTGGTLRKETPTGSEVVSKTEAAGHTTTATESRTTYDDTVNFKPTVQTVTETVPNEDYQETTSTTYLSRKTEIEESVLNGSHTTETETFTNRQTATTTNYNQLADTRVIEHNNNKSGTGAGHSITGAAEINEHYTERSGNIGVTTSQQMLESEFKVRSLYNLYFMFMREFITRYTY